MDKITIQTQHWLNWKEHPMTQLYFQYLEDKRNFNNRIFQNITTNGYIIHQDTVETLKRLSIANATVLDIQQIDDEQINAFYNNTETI